MTTATVEAPGSRTDTTMRVAVMAGIRDISVRDLPDPGARSRARSSSACGRPRSAPGSSGATAAPRPNKFPFVGGHEMAGEVAAIGPGTDTDLQIGERVAIGSASCGVPLVQDRPGSGLQGALRRRLEVRRGMGPGRVRPVQDPDRRRRLSRRRCAVRDRGAVRAAVLRPPREPDARASASARTSSSSAPASWAS